MRSLVSLKIVDSITPITFLNAAGELEECSGIEQLTTGGWNAVVQKGRFEKGQLFVYAECDTILPVDVPLFAFLEGKRIKTKKLKGVVSQGVCFTIPEILDVIADRAASKGEEALAKLRELAGAEWNDGDDWSEYVDAVKYDEYSTEKVGNNALKMMPGDARGKFPSFISKTDEERIQNQTKELKYHWKGQRAIAREKVHGSSITLYVKIDSALDNLPPRLDFGICSRNFELHLHSLETNNYVKAGLSSLHNLLAHCLDTRESIALQGELIGPGINGNPYNLPDFKILFFTAYDISQKARYTDKELCHLLHILELDNCPLVDVFELEYDLEGLLAKADAKSIINPKYDREGIVVRGVDSEFSFKVISNKWLLKEKD
jgi:RNA ligase (TIGR02306 family)